ncbi:MAG: Uma2 family endonuclease, partial [Cyanobacteria bacterium P01_A01_bin.135]
YGQQDDLRLSYVVWQEGVTPTVVVELISPGTEREDYGQTLRDAARPPTKWEVYEQVLRIPYYAIFNRYTDELQAFQNVAGRYEALPVTESRVWLPHLQLGLGLWQGSYQGNSRRWLRWYLASQDWVPMPEEQLQQERQRAEQERQRAEQERQRAERLAARLRELGIDPEVP